MKIETQLDPLGIHRVSLQGDLDFHSSAELRAALAKIAEAHGAKAVVNFEKVSYIDSSGLAAFVELFQKMKRYGGKLVLYNLSQGVRSVFEIAKLDTIFRLVSTEKEALALMG